MLRFIFILFLFVSSITLHAQLITVTDAVSNATLSNTLIYNTQKKTMLTTDQKGMADITVFSPTDTLFFEHEGYVTRPYTMSVLKIYNYKVNLFPDALMEDEWIHVFSFFPEKRKDIAPTISILSEHEIHSSSIQSNLDVLALFGNISLQKENQIKGGAILNGCNTENNVYLLDGIQLHSLLPIDIFNIQQIELINYSSSVISTNNAMGGSLYFQTQQAQFGYNDSTKKIIVNACTQLSSINMGLAATININMHLKNIASITSLSIGNFRSYKTGNNRSHGYADWGKVNNYASTINGIDTLISNEDANLQAYTGYKRSDITQSMLIKLNLKTDLYLFAHLSLFSTIYNQNRLYSNDTTNPQYAEWYYAPQNYFLTYAKLHAWKKQKLCDEFFITVSYEGNTEEEITRQFQSVDRLSYTNNKQYYSIHTDFIKYFNNKNHLNYGLAYNNDQLQSSASSENINTNSKQNIASEYPNGGSYWQNISEYINYTHHFNSALQFSLGFRLEYYSLKASAIDSIYTFLNNNSLSKKNTMANGIAAFSYKISNNYLFNYTFSTSSHLPNENELLRFSRDDNYFHLPNLSLLPSYSLKNELGLRISLLDNQLMLYPTIYFAYQTNTIAETTITSAIHLIDSLQLSRYMNIGNALIYGASYQIAAKMGEYASFTTNLYYTKGFVINPKTPQHYVAPLSAKMSVNYHFKSGIYCFYILYKGIKKANSYSNDIGENKTQATYDGIPAWYTFNVSTCYSISKNFTMCFSIENIFDMQYKTYASNCSAPGRNIVLSLHSTF